jgi:hypothetical protein
MKQNKKLGGILALIGALLGVIGHFLLFSVWYERGMAAEAAEPGCEILLKYIHPAITDLGLLAAVFFTVSAYGFFTSRKWAFPLSVIGTVLALQGSWFINVPFMAADLPPIYFTLFFPYLILFFLIIRLVGKVPWSRTLLGIVSGLAFIFCLMNGIASLSRIITIGSPIFFMVQRLHWVAMIGWGVVTSSILLKPGEWTRVLGLSAGVLELIVGIPLVIETTKQLGRFSLFSLAPIACFILIVLLVWPGVWERLTGISEKSPVAQTKSGTPAISAAD